MGKIYKVLGLMSGTSLDGLDLCYCHIRKEMDTWDFKILRTKSITYTKQLQLKLKEAILLNADELLQLHNSYGTWLGEQVKAFVTAQNLDVDFIASHGHTTHHQPQKGITFQIGSGQHLANACGVKTICDFRTNDVALQGQGAPLVPIGDQFFFNGYDFCLNLGGISNVSFEKDGKRIAYDIGLANMILNYCTQKVDLDYDKGGRIASTGTINTKMLNALNSLGYYSKPFPKSIGYEWFVKEVIPILENTQDNLENLLHTAVHHICEKIAEQLKRNTTKNSAKLLVTGGGALNDFLIKTIQEKLGNTIEVHIPSKIIIEFKEALIFALMGALRIEKKINVLSSVTGAKRDSSSGVIYMPN